MTVELKTQPPELTTPPARSKCETDSGIACACKKAVRGLRRMCACCLAVTGCACLPCLMGTALASPTTATTAAQHASDLEDRAPRLLEEIDLPYPEAAAEADVQGVVTVLVEVDKAGSVVSTHFESGPEMFRAVSLDTASRLRFAPATTNGEPVAATTRISFQFVPPTGLAGEPPAIPNAELVVHSSNPDLEDTRARTTLDERDLERTSGDDLADTTSQIAGVRTAGGNTDSAKPIIRGQHERRLLVLNNGVRHESQKWGPDHATAIDPFSAGSISVIRGAAGARYGPDAIGGVILVEPPPMRTDPGVYGKVLTAYNSNGNRPYTALRLDTGSESGISTRIEGNYTIGSTLSAPNYLLGNTASRVWNIGGSVAYAWDSGSIQTTVHHHDFVAGVFYGVNHNTPDELMTQFEASEPVTANLWESTYEIDRPYQDVTHDLGELRTDLSGDWGALEAVYAFQINLRREYEHVRMNRTHPQYDFTLRTHSLDAVYTHPEATYDFGELAGGVGLEGGFQENVYTGAPLIPNYRSFSGGLFAYERISWSRVDVEVGARADSLARAAYINDNSFDAHVRRGTLNPDNCEALDQSSRCAADYTAGSFSVGTLVHAVPDMLDVKLDLSTATRFPNVDELYMLGQAPTSPVYANGHPDLEPETIWNASFVAGLRTLAVETEASVFGQRVEDYIYFAPELGPDGTPRFDVTIRGTWPTYGFQQIDADFYGFDGSIEIGPNAPLSVQALGGIVRAQSRETGDQLIGTPADYLKLSAAMRPSDVGSIRNIELSIHTDLVAKQTRVNEDHDFVPTPDGYTLWGASVEMELGQKRPIRFGIEGNNLLNTAYREYTSLLRYYGDQPGRDVRVRAGFDF